MEIEKQTLFCILKDEKIGEVKRYLQNICDSWHQASFDNEKQVKKFFKRFKIKIEKEYTTGKDYQSYIINKNLNFINCQSFWKLSEIPKHAKKIKALSSGAIVTCYYTDENNTITMFKPNPNSKEVYKPLKLKQQIKHISKYGIY